MFRAPTGELSEPLAVKFQGPKAQRNLMRRFGTMGGFPSVDGLRKGFERSVMETPKHLTDTRVCTSPIDNTCAPAAMASVVKLPIRTVRTVPLSEALDMGRYRPRLRGGSDDRIETDGG